MAAYEAHLRKLTIEDLFKARILRSVHGPLIRSEMSYGQSAWDAMCKLGLKPATLTDLEIWARMKTLRKEHPELDEEALVHEGMRHFKGHTTPDKIRKALRKKISGT